MNVIFSTTIAAPTRTWPVRSGAGRRKRGFRSTVAGEVSQLLLRWQDGDAAALVELTPLVYEELRKLGHAHLHRAPHQVLLQPTALVHEFWLEIEGKPDLDLRTRARFFALAARIMRDLLVDYCRRQRAAKRGGSRIRVPFDDAEPGTGARQLDSSSSMKHSGGWRRSSRDTPRSSS